MDLHPFLRPTDSQSISYIQWLENASKGMMGFDSKKAAFHGISGKGRFYVFIIGKIIHL
jgi:hypothetical protein